MKLLYNFIETILTCGRFLVKLVYIIGAVFHRNTSRRLFLHLLYMPLDKSCNVFLGLLFFTVFSEIVLAMALILLVFKRI